MFPIIRRKFPLFIIVSLIFFYILYLIYYSYYPINVYLKEALSSSTPSENNSTNQAIITFYYQQNDSKCPDCKNAKIEWDAFMQENNGNSVNGYSIVCNTMDCSDAKNPSVVNALEQNNITDLPAVSMIVNGRNLNYHSEITQSNLE